MLTMHEVITFLVSMQISISSLQTHNVNRCGRSRHLARKLSLRSKRSSPNVFEMAATENITIFILIKLIRVSLVKSFPTRRSSDLSDLFYRLFCWSLLLCLLSPVIANAQEAVPWRGERDRKSTRLNSSHVSISYAVFCLKIKKKDQSQN